MGEETMSQSRKRKTNVEDVILPKRSRNRDSASEDEEEMVNELVPGKIIRVALKNFMCHDALEINFNSRINFIIGKNGSGKSAIMTALTVGFGAKARDTERGASLQSFVKQGKSSATVTITITNRGDNSYKWEEYGDTITIVRQIGNVSSYKIKSHNGQVMSTKREEVDNITKALNIQVNNPIAILNQDASRSFLKSKKPEDLYQFYMKATRLDILRDNYKEAVKTCDNAKTNLAHAMRYMKDNEKILKDLEQKLKALESLDQYREERQELELEILWAAVIEEEKKLLKFDKNIEHQQKEIEKLENVELNKATQEKEIKDQIEAHKAEILDLESNAAASREKTQKLKEKAVSLKKQADELREKVRKFHRNIKDKEADLETLKNEIANMEREASRADERRQAAQHNLENAEQLLDEVQATLRTKQTDLMHHEENKSRISQEENRIKLDMEGARKEIHKAQNGLQAFQNQPNDALNVYGRDFPRLVRRIEEEYKRGRFQKKPIGPLGSYVSIRDQTWIPAIENYIGYNTWKAFCVDNNQDSRTLNTIIREIFHPSQAPQIINSTFMNEVHDVSQKRTNSSRYPNILDMMEITDVTVANTLIDQKSIEQVILIPTSEEACNVMDKAHCVPRNCRQAITKHADLFYPDPNYKTYGGRVTPNSRPKFLQVSSGDAILALQEELKHWELQMQMIQESYSTLLEKKAQNQKEHNQVRQQVSNLLSKQTQHKNTIEESREQLDSFNNNIINEHKSEIEHLTKWLEQHKAQESQMMDEWREKNKEAEAAGQDAKQCRGISDNLEATLRPIKEKINELKDELRRLDVNSRGANKRLQEAKQSLQKLHGEHQQLQRVLNSKVIAAEARCPRIESTQTVVQIEHRIRELRRYIEDVERQHGNKETLSQEYEEHKQKYSGVQEKAETLQKLYDEHRERIEYRKGYNNKMRADVAQKVQDSFSNILSLRNYNGSIKVNYKMKTLDLEMSPKNDAQRLTNDAKALSGGERSYSTIGFIMSLWHCTGLPFYFLDEFDVFMDKINRRMIMDILIHHASKTEKSQFTFLTPLDSSHLKASSMITIHRMAPPERSQ